MSTFQSLHGPCPHIPDDLSVAQFILDSHHPQRPTRNSSKPWLIDDTSDRTCGLEELRTDTYGLANALHRRWGIGEDDIVCVFSSNHIDYPTVLWACHRLGAIVTTANPNYGVEELVHQLSTTNASLIICHPESVNTALAAARQHKISTDCIVLMDQLTKPLPIPFVTVRELAKEGLTYDCSWKERKLNPGEGKTKLAFLCFSSGTTGKPKAVAIPHYAVIANVIQMSAYHKVNEDYTTWNKRRFRPGDVAVAVLPFFHIYGLVVNLHWLLFSGLSVVVIPKFNFEAFLESIRRHRVTHLMLVPPQVVLFCKHPSTKKYDLSQIRFCISGAAPLSRELTQQLIKVMPNAEIGQGYGMTETCTTVSMFPPSQRIGTMGSAGQFMPGVQARIVKEDGSLAGYNEVGELHVSGPQMALRYLNNKEATSETFVDGWVRTGDEVYLDKSGDLFVVDRLKEMLKVRGFQVAPAELEGHLLSHPAVADACVVGVPDGYSGEVPFAFVVLGAKAAKSVKRDKKAAEHLKRDIVKYVADAKVSYKHLKGGLEFVDVIPKNPSGKLLRRVMREMAKGLSNGSAVQAKL